MRDRGSRAAAGSIVVLAIAAAILGCRGNQYARIIQPGDKQMMGSHQAGQETFAPLVDEAVAKLLARHPHQHIPVQYAGTGAEPLPPPKSSICFVGIENCTAEEIGDFKAQLYELIDAKIAECDSFTSVNRRWVDAGLKELRVKPEELFIPDRMRMFVDVMQKQGQPFQYLLFAKLTSGTTRENKDYQRDYLLTLELVDIRTGEQDKQSATLSKGYHHSWTSRARSTLGAK
jgi:hypothetical protein